VPLPAAPVTPLGLPRAVEPLAAYVQQRACDPSDKPGAVGLGRLLTRTFPGTSFGVSRSCAADGFNSEHYEGRALDWMISARKPAQAAQAAAALNWMFARDAGGNRWSVARRLGIMYMIWNDRIWGAYATESGWRPYSTCARHPEPAWDTTCHRDHVHISLTWAGAMGRTSFWTRSVAGADYGPCRPSDLNWAPPYTGPRRAPCPAFPTVVAPSGSSPVRSSLVRYSGAVVRTGFGGPVVAAVQRALGVTADGAFGPGTAAAVTAFRERKGLGRRAVVDAPTWRALLSAPPARQRPAPGPAPAPPAGRRPAHPELLRWKGTVLRKGARGPAVLALQKRLGVRRTAYFGPLTRAAVLDFQRARRLPRTGVVARPTWAALIR